MKLASAPQGSKVQKEEERREKKRKRS